MRADFARTVNPIPPNIKRCWYIDYYCISQVYLHKNLATKHFYKKKFNNQGFLYIKFDLDKRYIKSSNNQGYLYKNLE